MVTLFQQATRFAYPQKRNEKTARGGERLRYPWGDENWDKQRANIAESDFGHPTPVGIYPKGATKLGLHDMAGNMWEWTLSQGGNYPYDPKRNEREGANGAALRGGSWVDDSGGARRGSLQEQSRLLVRHQGFAGGGVPGEF